MKFLDRACAGALFLVAIVECWRVPPKYPGRLWIFGSGLALLFTAMLNLLRLRAGSRVPGLRLFCIGANTMTLAWLLSLIASIGAAQVHSNPQVLLIACLIFVETVLSFVPPK
jgi:hypothetical protein